MLIKQFRSLLNFLENCKPSVTVETDKKEHPIKNRVFRMMLPVDPCHGSRDVSRNEPGSRKEPQRPDTPGMLQS